MSALTADRYLDARVATVEAKRAIRRIRVNGPLFRPLLEAQTREVQRCIEREGQILAAMGRAPVGTRWEIGGGGSGFGVERMPDDWTPGGGAP